MPGEAAEDVDVVGSGEVGEENFSFGGRGIGGAGHVHTEPAGEHFRQHEERSGSEPGCCCGEGGFHCGKVGGAVLPDDIELDSAEFHKKYWW